MHYTEDFSTQTDFMDKNNLRNQVHHPWFKDVIYVKTSRT